MANNYTQWSEKLVLSCKEEIDWLRQILYFDASEYKNSASKVIKEKFEIEVDSYDAEFFPDFSIEFDSDNEVYVYSDSGKVDNAVLVFQAFLKKFRPNSYFKIEWADTCSKPRAGEFGGGAVFITADNVQWMNTNTWVSKCEKIFLDSQLATKE